MGSDVLKISLYLQFVILQEDQVDGEGKSPDKVIMHLKF